MMAVQHTIDRRAFRGGESTYSLGVDLGTTFSAAALVRDGRVETLALGTSAPAIPSVVVLRADGEVIVGEAAERRGVSEPGRTAREFKRRLGDPTPFVIGGSPFGAEALMAHLLRTIVAQVSEREGEPADRIVLTHPANYGPYKLDLLREAARLAGLDLPRVTFLSEPVAAAITYASQQRVETGAVVAVYDFGGGTFDAAAVRKTMDGFEVIGTPEGIDRLGGIDIDAAVLAHVDEALDGALTKLDGSDPAVRAALARLRDECRKAKEVLSTDTDTVIPVSVPGLQTEVRLTRAELEAMIRPRLHETVEALQRAVASSGVPMDQISRVVLVGGTSRMPLIGELVREATGRPVGLDAHPKFAIANGAAAYAGTMVVPAAGQARVMPAAAAEPEHAPPATTASAPASTASAPVKRPVNRTPILLVGAALVAAIAVGGTLLFVGGSPSPSLPSATSPSGAASIVPAASSSGGPSGSTFGDDAFLTRLVGGSSGMTIAVDSDGVFHFSTSALVQDQNTVYYGRCTDRCDQTASWLVVPLAIESSVTHVPTIALTANGRPRILYAAVGPPEPGYHYLECDVGCDQFESWRSVRLTQFAPGPNLAPKPRVPFAVSGDGSATFAYDDGSAMYLWLCDRTCGARGSWTQVMLAEEYFYAEAVAFASGQDIQVIARHAVEDEEGLALFDCTRDCGSRASWGVLDPLWVTPGMQAMALTRTGDGGTRILAYGDDNRTPGDERVFQYFACDSRCADAASWLPPIQPPLAPNSASLGFSLALDGTGAPVVTTLTDEGAVIARCSGDCTGLGGLWTPNAGVSVSDLNTQFEPLVPSGCERASWGMFVGPALALDPQDTPVVVFTAHAKAFDGECGTGSAATTTDSFLFSAP